MNPTATAGSATTAAAAAAAAALVPAQVPLAAVPAAAGDRPPADAVAHVASFVGAAGADVVLVADAAIADALSAGAVAGLDVADALRPALEAASQALGPGVLGATRTERAEEVVGRDTEVFALQHDDATLAWFGVRRRVQPAGPAPTDAQRHAGMRVLYDVEMTLTAEIGRARLPVRQVLDLVPGSVLELDRTAGSPADVMVNGRLVARGEIVVIDESYGVRITEIVPADAG
jgi:flagellar motor switch protein FliN/FliY